jgi:hypothetical protein
VPLSCNTLFPLYRITGKNHFIADSALFLTGQAIITIKEKLHLTGTGSSFMFLRNLFAALAPDSSCEFGAA